MNLTLFDGFRILFLVCTLTVGVLSVMAGLWLFAVLAFTCSTLIVVLAAILHYEDMEG